MVQIRFLGGAQEIGRSSILVEGEKEKFLLDYGLEVQDHKVPIKPDLDLSGVFPSHAHLDHCGMLPELYHRGYQGSVYSTPATFGLSLIMLADAIKVQRLNGLELLYLPHDIEKMEIMRKAVGFQEPVVFGDAEVTLFDAGHVPGSASTLVEIDDKRILYTGDIKFTESRLMAGAFQDYRDIDVLMCDSTYYNKNHSARPLLEQQLRSVIEETAANNGTTVLPCFAVGRTQEILLIAAEADVPISLDGMGIATTQTVLDHPESVKDHQKLQRAFGKAEKITEPEERRRASKEPGVIITTAGMLQGGPVSFYIKKLHKKENCSLVLTGFQVPGTVGRTLMDTGRYIHEGIDVKLRMKMEFMDFSAHCGKDSLLQFLEKVSPEKVVPVHTFDSAAFVETLRTLGFAAEGPAVGDRIGV